MMVFMRETGWEKGKDWVTSVARTGGKKTMNGITYEVVSVVGGLINLSAKPASARK